MKQYQIKKHMQRKDKTFFVKKAFCVFNLYLATCNYMKTNKNIK